MQTLAGTMADGNVIKRFGHLFSDKEQRMISGERVHSGGRSNGMSGNMVGFLAFSRQMAKASDVSYLDKTKKAK